MVRRPYSTVTVLARLRGLSTSQMGETALVSKAITYPVTSRLQRVFGVSQLKVDTTFTSGSELPQARLTLQQQVASNIRFTYVTALNDPNTQIIRAEWAAQPSVISDRDAGPERDLQHQFFLQEAISLRGMAWPTPPRTRASAP
jgi:hypothetical protein